MTKATVFDKGVLTEERVVLITGGLGFIGSHLVKHWICRHYNDKIIVLDSVTYAARPKYLNDFLEDYKKSMKPDVTIEHVDIRDQVAVARIMQKYRPDLVLHLAAESHVCRSISGPKEFIMTNVVGTFNLIEEFRQLWDGDKSKRFVHVSTDEVFGELDPVEDAFDEATTVKPRSPYAASKASSDHIVQAYHHTYGIPTIVTNCSNNFGPNQHPEKLIPQTIERLASGRKALLFGDGSHIRDWLFVQDHVWALDLLVHRGIAGQRYCIGGDNEMTNLEVVHEIARLMGIQVGDEFLEFVDSRPTDDKRYSVDCSKLKHLGWSPSDSFEKNLTDTIAYYVRELGGDRAAPETEGAVEGVQLV